MEVKLYDRSSPDDDQAIRGRNIALKQTHYPSPLASLSAAIFNRDPQRALTIINQSDFQTMVNDNKGKDIMFDQMFEVLKQLYNDYDNFIHVPNLGNRGKTIIDPKWDTFIISYKKLIDSVNHYRYDNELQF